jgi:S-adenosylmethionine hydrolase
LSCHLIYLDTFGNAKLTALAEDLAAALGTVTPGERLRAIVDGTALDVAWRTTFGEAGLGEPLLYEDSYGRLCLAVNQGDAAQLLGLREDTPVSISRA